jgi:hypothetical protein
MAALNRCCEAYAKSREIGKQSVEAKGVGNWYHSVCFFEAMNLDCLGGRCEARDFDLGVLDGTVGLPPARATSKASTVREDTGTEAS